MTNKFSDIDEFKRALTMAMRSISKQDELTVSFGADKGNLSGLKARLPMPNKNMDNDQINSLRGEADSLALYLAHHKEIVDKKRIRFILQKIKIKSKKLNLDPKITNRIWKNMIWSYIDYERRNFKKK